MKQPAYEYFHQKLLKKSDAAERQIDQMAFDETKIKKVHFVGICGKATASLAGLFVKAGFTVTGSDDAWNPPMSTMLETIGIEGALFDPKELEGVDLIVIGNVFKPSDPETIAVRKSGVPQISAAQAYALFFIKDTRSIVVAGTHGKTTTSSLAAHIFLSAAKKTNVLVGGVMKNIGESYQYAGPDAEYSIVEGDEYDTAYFDKGPKFLHYRPTIGVITSIEFDHSDIYDDMDDYLAAFVFFAAEIPQNGYLLLHEGIKNEYKEKIKKATEAKIYEYGLSMDSMVHAYNIRTDIEKGGQYFDVSIAGKTYTDFFIPMFGKYNVENVVSIIVIAMKEGIAEETIKTALATFLGAEQRQQVLYNKDGVIVIDDFAHHPTAVRVTLEGIREHYPNQRIIAIFEPRSNASRRKDFEIPYSEAFGAADVIVLKTPPFRHNDTVDNFVDLNTVVKNLQQKNKEAFAFSDVASILDFVVKTKKAGDVLVLMSNGHFDGLREKVIAAL